MFEPAGQQQEIGIALPCSCATLWNVITANLGPRSLHISLLYCRCVCTWMSDSSAAAGYTAIHGCSCIELYFASCWLNRFNFIM
jgi:hypothetical protein